MLFFLVSAKNDMRFKCLFVFSPAPQLLIWLHFEKHNCRIQTSRQKNPTLSPSRLKPGGSCVVWTDATHMGSDFCKNGPKAPPRGGFKSHVDRRRLSLNSTPVRSDLRRNPIGIRFALQSERSQSCTRQQSLTNRFLKKKTFLDDQPPPALSDLPLRFGRRTRPCSLSGQRREWLCTLCDITHHRMKDGRCRGRRSQSQRTNTNKLPAWRHFFFPLWHVPTSITQADTSFLPVGRLFISLLVISRCYKRIKNNNKKKPVCSRFAA